MAHQRPRQLKVQSCKADSLHLQPRSEHNTGADMRTLLIAAIGFGLMIQLLYLSLAGLSSTLAKYDYCYDAVMAAINKVLISVPVSVLVLCSERGCKCSPVP